MISQPQEVMNMFKSPAGICIRSHFFKHFQMDNLLRNINTDVLDQFVENFCTLYKIQQKDKVYCTKKNTRQVEKYIIGNSGFGPHREMHSRKTLRRRRVCQSFSRYTQSVPISIDINRQMLMQLMK